MSIRDDSYAEQVSADPGRLWMEPGAGGRIAWRR